MLGPPSDMSVSDAEEEAKERAQTAAKVSDIFLGFLGLGLLLPSSFVRALAPYICAYMLACA